MTDDYTILNPGFGGDVMDETLIVYPTSPTNRKRPRVVLTGEGIDDIVPAQTSPTNGTEFGLVTRPVVPSYPGIEANLYADVSMVPSGIETTIVTYTVPVDKTFYFIGLNASGNANGLYKLYVDGTSTLAGRTSVANLTLSINYAYSPVKVEAGDTIAIKVTHYASVACEFEGTILGYIL
jgi:PKD repeat protein